MVSGATEAPVPRRPRGDLALLAGLALAKLVLHLFAMGRYGYFRDELYYLASTRHLDWGYVEHPPLSIAVLAAFTWVFGDSLAALRLLPALAGAAMAFVTGLVARELGGGRYAQALAALTVIVAPVYLGTHHYYSMNAFDQLFWTLAAGLLVLLLKTAEPRAWLGLGLVMGLALLNKLSALWLAAGLLAGLLASPRRRALLTRWPWIAAGVAALIFLPHVVWQVQHGWPVREFVRNATTLKMVSVSPWDFVAQQVLTMNPLTLPVWLTGLLHCLFARGGRPWHSLAVAYSVVVVILILNGTSRASYLSPAYPLLLAPGAVAIEGALGRRGWGWLKAPAAALLLLGGALLAPFALPLLPPESFIRYSRALGVTPPQFERSARGELPQQYADMFGWEEMARTVARVYRALPPGERAKCAVFAQNYGEAGAVDVLGRKLGLPGALSGHNSYWLWGPGSWTGEIVIILGGDLEDHAAVFQSVQRAATVQCRWCMPYERGLGVYVARRLKMSVAEIWPRVRLYI